MFLIVDFETAFHTRHVGMFVFNLHTVFHFSSSTDSLVISTKPNLMKIFALSYFTLCNNTALINVACFRKMHHFRTVNLVSLPRINSRVTFIVGNTGARCWGVLNLHYVRDKFRGNSPAGSKVEVGMTPVRPHGGRRSQVFCTF